MEMTSEEVMVSVKKISSTSYIEQAIVDKQEYIYCVWAEFAKSGSLSPPVLRWRVSGILVSAAGRNKRKRPALAIQYHTQYFTT